MTLDIPLVNGTSYCTVSAFSEESFNKAIEFYKTFLFLEHRSLSANSALLFNGIVSLKLELHSDAVKQQKVDLRIEELKANVTKRDWRAMVPESLVFNTSDILVAKQSLTDLKVPKQCYPNEIYPMQVYTFDPLGNVIGVTSTKNAVSTY